ncbi:helix-turn-helix domain-containing protein [Tardiphaga sp. 20_F10_N6_6]|uniref:helix-turn-helix domain-containing protein n=1 Tax=Tardiphaga sp. 20_F10_N6_6 TaxID=3240788 RepID=UPI003F89A67B
MKTSRVELTSNSKTIFNGVMHIGSVFVTRPLQAVSAVFEEPCDFVHFHILSGCYQRVRRDAIVRLPSPIRDLPDLIIRDTFAELLGRALIQSGCVGYGPYTRSIGQTLLVHLTRPAPELSAINALPKWRLKRVEEYVAANLERGSSLSELAKLAGLSRMHFAAQFRAATGYRPHDYILQKRIEAARTLLCTTDTPLAQIALSVGFQAQAHFSTVFKRLTGDTPARWRRSAVTQKRAPKLAASSSIGQSRS